jgi:hypothetical protein
MSGITEKTTLDQNAAAEFLGLSPRRLENWRQQRRGPKFSYSRRCVRYKVADLVAWQSAHAVETGERASV